MSQGPRLTVLQADVGKELPGHRALGRVCLIMRVLSKRDTG